jgi:8-oxo-dGTP pyrophosphatase MutT (NUDIX family)
MPISDQIRELRSLIGTRLLQVPSVAAIIRDADGGILLQLRSRNGRWGLPSGAIDPGETPEEAVVREVREETGLEVEPLRLLGVFSGRNFRYTYDNGDEVEYMVALFECRVVGGQAGDFDDETLEVRCFSPDEVPELEMPYPRELFG